MKIARILIVDDEPLIRQSLAGVLDDEGYQTHSVASGEECCEELAHASGCPEWTALKLWRACKRSHSTIGRWW